MYVFAHSLSVSGLCLRLEQQVQAKEVLEREMYSRFVMVLNKKKAKIRGLQDAVRQLQQTDDQQRDREGRQRSAWLALICCPLAYMASFAALKYK